MEEVPVLTCPVCDQSACFSELGVDDEAALKDAAWDHLDSHRLTESKQAIYGVMMVDRLDRRTVDPHAVPGPEFDEWVDQLSPGVSG